MTNQTEYRPGDTIVLVPHDPRWADDFASESALVKAAFGDVLVELHHIGSTAIPGIVAKPVIDMLAVVTDVALLDTRPWLEHLGYEAMGEFGIQGRRYFRKTTPQGVRTHQIHSYTVRSPEIDRHLAFRDYLRNNPKEAQQYAQLKKDLAQRFAIDVEGYADAKTEFIREIERCAMSQPLSRDKTID